MRCRNQTKTKSIQLSYIYSVRNWFKSDLPKLVQIGVKYILTKVGSNRTPISYSCHRNDRSRIHRL